MRETFKLLNKNLNFATTENKINKKELRNQLDDFYGRIILKGHFQDTRKQAHLCHKKYGFKSENNKHWMPTETQHTKNTSINVTKIHINEQLTKTKKKFI